MPSGGAPTPSRSRPSLVRGRTCCPSRQRSLNRPLATRVRTLTLNRQSWCVPYCLWLLGVIEQLLDPGDDRSGVAFLVFPCTEILDRLHVGRKRHILLSRLDPDEPKLSRVG